MKRITVTFLKLAGLAILIAVALMFVHLCYDFLARPDTLTDDEFMAAELGFALRLISHLAALVLGLSLASAIRYVGDALTPRLPAITFCATAAALLLRWRVELAIAPAEELNLHRFGTTIALEFGITLLLGIILNAVFFGRKAWRPRAIDGMSGRGQYNDLPYRPDFKDGATFVTPLLAVAGTLIFGGMAERALSFIQDATLKNIAVLSYLWLFFVSLGFAVFLISVYSGAALEATRDLRHESDVAESYLRYRLLGNYLSRWHIAGAGYLLMYIAVIFTDHAAVIDLLPFLIYLGITPRLAIERNRRKEALPPADEIQEKIFAFELQNTF